MNGPAMLDRRRVLAGGGALIVSFSLGDALAQDARTPAVPPPPASTLRRLRLMEALMACSSAPVKRRRSA